LGTAEVSLSDLVYKSLEYKNDVFNECGEADEKLVIVGCQDNNNSSNTNPDAQNTTDNTIKKPNDGNEKVNAVDEIDLNDTPSLIKSHDISSYLTITKTVPINYLNPRLIPANTKGDDELTKLPEFTVEVTISNFLIDPEVIEHGNFINLHINELYPVPEEWSLKEGTEKDLNSSNNFIILLLLSFFLINIFICYYYFLLFIYYYYFYIIYILLLLFFYSDYLYMKIKFNIIFKLTSI